LKHLDAQSPIIFALIAAITFAARTAARRAAQAPPPIQHDALTEESSTLPMGN
jgi:hypothetical protein